MSSNEININIILYNFYIIVLLFSVGVVVWGFFFVGIFFTLTAHCETDV